MKDLESQKKFQKSTTETNEFSNCFNNNLDVLKQVENRRKVLRNQLINQKADSIEIQELTNKISEYEAKENRDEIIKHFISYSDNPESINLHKMWQTLEKISPKSGTSLPTAKKNHRGRIVSAPGELKKLLAKEYKDRLRNRPRRPDLLYLDERRKKFF